MTAAALTLSTQVPVNALAGFNQSYCIQVLLRAMSIKVYIHSCNFMIPAPLFYEVNDPLLQVCYKP